MVIPSDNDSVQMSVSVPDYRAEDEEEDEQNAAHIRKQHLREFNTFFTSNPYDGMAAFIFYAHVNRSRVLEQEAASEHFGQVAAILVREFRALSEQERQRYADLAETSWANMNFRELLKKYETQPASKKPRNDPTAPKRHKSAFMIYSIENRDRIVAENPDLSSEDIAQKTFEDFRALTPREQQFWHVKAAADKRRYLKEINCYEAANSQREEETEDGADGPEATIGSDKKPAVTTTEKEDDEEEEEEEDTDTCDA